MKVTITPADEYIDRLAAAGFLAGIVPTGGGCDAIAIDTKGHRVLITDDAQVPDTPDYCCVGLYGPDYGFVRDIDTDLNGVVAAVKALTDELPLPRSSDHGALCLGEAVTVCCGAMATFHDTELCCKNCWEAV